MDEVAPIREAQVQRMVNAVTACRQANHAHVRDCNPETDLAVNRARALLEACARNCTLDELTAADSLVSDY